MLFPKDETSKVIQPQSAPIRPNEKRVKECDATAAANYTEESVFVKERKIVQTATQDAQKPFTKDEIAGLRYERALPGDKRLA